MACLGLCNKLSERVLSKGCWLAELCSKAGDVYGKGMQDS